MIVKLETGNGFRGALSYDVRAGKGTPKELARVLDAQGVSYDFDDNGDILINPKQVGFDFRQQTMGYTGEGVIRKPVYHWVLSYSPKDNVSEEQMQKDAKEFLKRIGFDDTQYVMTVHYDKKHHHLHIVTNIVNNHGKRISTMGLIEKAHAAAAAITKENGYTWGERTKKESITKEKIHDPHDRARKIIEPVIREAKDRAVSLDEFKKILESRGISCKITLARDGKRGGISYAYEYEGMVHPFRGSSVGRELSFSYIGDAIKANRLKAEKEKYEDIRAGFNATIPHVANELISIRNNCYRLYRDVSDAGIAVKTETAGKYDELRAVWQQFRELNETRKNETDTVRKTEVLGGMLMLLNPIVGLLVIFLAEITGDVRESSQREQKKQLLQKIESVRNEITDLAAKKAQLDIKKSECLKDYLDAKQMLQEYKDGLKTVDKEIHDMRAERPKVTAASLQKAFSQMQKTPLDCGMSPDYLSQVIRNDIANSPTARELNLKLLKDDIHLTPIKNSIGLVSDLKITHGGRDTTLSSIAGTKETVELVSAWGRLSDVPAVQPRFEQEMPQKQTRSRVCREEPEEDLSTGYTMHM